MLVKERQVYLHGTFQHLIQSALYILYNEEINVYIPLIKGDFSSYLTLSYSSLWLSALCFNTESSFHETELYLCDKHGTQEQPAQSP